jgi:hypothetical protein
MAPRSPILGKAIDMLGVGCAVPFRKQHLKALPEHFVGPVAKDLFRPEIEQRDLMLIINGNDRIGSNSQNAR